MSRQVTLTVKGAEKRDAGRGVARLPESARRALSVLSGDTVVIEGERPTVAKVWPAGGGDGVVRIDAETRANARVNVGDPVTVAPVSVAEADRVVVEIPTDADDELLEAIANDLRDRPLQAGETIRLERPGVRATVIRTEPDGTVRVTGNTTVRVRERPAADTDDGGAKRQHSAESERTAPEPTTDATYEDIGGLDEELEQVREMIELPLSEPDLFRKLGIDPPSGVLLYGPPGTGKTLIAKAVANAGTRDEDADMENRVVAQLLTLMDGLEERGQVIVVGATNRVDAIDPALRRGGRFDREIEIGAPDESGRREILDVHTRGMPLSEDVDLDELAARTHGFVGADVHSLATEAAMRALRDRENREDLTVTRTDLEAALTAVDPSTMREYVAETPHVTFEDVGGLEEPKRVLTEAVEWPLAYGALFEATNTDPPSGILLYGPPGTGKTLLARALAGESDVNFVSVAGPELLDKYVGESEQAVREVFDRARQAAPSIVFFDEIDALAGVRGDASESTERVVSQLLAELDGLAANPNVVVLAATNRIEALDPALLRPGRLESHVEIPAPDRAARREILAVHAAGKPLGGDVDLDAVADRTEGLSGAELESIVREASMRAIRGLADEIGPEAATERADEVEIGAAHVEAALAEFDGEEI